MFQKKLHRRKIKENRTSTLIGEQLIMSRKQTPPSKEKTTSFNICEVRQLCDGLTSSAVGIIWLGKSNFWATIKWCILELFCLTGYVYKKKENIIIYLYRSCKNKVNLKPDQFFSFLICVDFTSSAKILNGWCKGKSK